MDVEFSAVNRHDSVGDTSILSSISRFLKDNVIDVLEDLTPVENRRPAPGLSSSCPRGARSDPMKLEPMQPMISRPLADTTNIKVLVKSPVNMAKDDEWGWNDSPVAPKALPRARGGAAKKKLLVSSKEQNQKVKLIQNPVDVVNTPQNAKKDTSRSLDQDPPLVKIKTPSSAEKGLLGAVVTGISVFGKQATDFLNTLDANFEQIFTGNDPQPQPSSSSLKPNSPEIIKAPPSAPAPAPQEDKPLAASVHPNLVQVEHQRQSVSLKVIKKVSAPEPAPFAPPLKITTIMKETSVVDAMMDSLDLNKTIMSSEPSSALAQPSSSLPAAAPSNVEKKKVQVKALMHEMAALSRENEQLARQLAESRQAPSLPLSEDENLALMMKQVESLMEDKARLMAENARLANENQGLHMLLAFTTEATNAAMGTPDRWRLHTEAISLLSPSPSQLGSGSDGSSYYSYLIASAKKSPTIGSHSSHSLSHYGGGAETESFKAREETVSRSLEFQDDDRTESTVKEMAAVRQYYNLLFSQPDIDEDADEIDLIVEELVASVEEKYEI